jgi:hypothetical protein
MEQLRIDFFWPLVEQIPLDLDYERCHKRVLTNEDFLDGRILVSDGTGITTASNLSWTNVTINIEPENIILKVQKKPNIIRRIMMKALGVKWSTS